MDRLNFLKLGHLLKIMLLLLLLLFSSFFLFLLCVFTFYTRQPGREGGREGGSALSEGAVLLRNITRRGYTAYFSHRPFVRSYFAPFFVPF